MSALTPDQFDEFFHALYGYDPFPWQARLARQVASAQKGDTSWPEALALPTAAGKTACIDMAVFALACQADWAHSERTAPLRVFFVVDRRVIVDETFERAQNLAAKLRAAKDGILKTVAEQLRALAGGDEPLACFQLRGGMYRDDTWVRSPLQPTIVTTTVDQYGSRLLFRGYGPSHSMWPIHAGLAANDSLVILDEAHCANPFRQTVEAVRRYSQWSSHSDNALSAPFHLTLVSATPPAGVKNSFTAGDDDRQHKVLGARIRAAKPAKLVEVRNARGNDALERLAERIAGEAVDLVSGERQAIGVIVNRVVTARKVHDILAAKGKQVVLLTGRMRSIDKDDVIEQLAPLKSNSDARAAALERPLFVVATQTLEVGADLDFDGLVSECASLDALRQRFGRLNRTGRDIEARATIVVRADQSNPSRGDDPIYGTALAETWQWLKKRSPKDEINLGYEDFDRLLPSDREELDILLRRLAAPAPDAPVMLPAHVDAWVQTQPTPLPDPDVSLFLHGPGRGAPEAQVCWRADLQAGLSMERQVEIVSLCPPVSSECIPVPIHTLRRWLRGEESAQDLSDLEGGRIEDTEGERSQINRNVLCWRGPEESYLITDPAMLRPGDTVVIPVGLGGWDIFGHVPPSPGGDPIIDLGDRAHLQSRAIPVLRIHHKTVESWPSRPARDALLEIASAPEPLESEDEIRALLRDLATTEESPEWLQDAANELARDRRLKVIPHPGGGIVLRGSSRVPKYTASGATLTSEDDSSSATVEVSLEEHSLGVEAWARRFAQKAGLPESLVEDLALAAKLHDVGKADPRFQAMLHGGDSWAAQAAGVLLAKSGGLPLGRRESRRAHRESGYPEGGRHELLSVRLVEKSPLFLERAHDPELVLHLIGSHHGRCRPFAPVVNDREPLKVEATIFSQKMSAASDTGLERLDSGVPERFWRLVRRYGWWGLAWLEALLRLADHRRSAEEQERARPPRPR